MTRPLRLFAVVIILGFTHNVSAQIFDDLFEPPPPRRPIQRSVPAPAPKPPPPPQELADPPYQSRLDRLSEILGALHSLAPLCYPAEKTAWREAMFMLLDGENPTPGRRERMIATFNRTYNGFRENYRVCNPSARLAYERYREEGVRLARDLTSRFTD